MAVKKILSVKVSDLTLDPNNARKHGEKDLAAIVASLEKFSQQTPIVITSDNVVIKGNGTLMAAMKLGWTHVDAIRTNLTGQQITAYAIADNRTSDLSEFDNEKLLELLQGLDEQSLIDACGFDEMAMAELLQEVEYLQPKPEIVEDEVPEPPGDPITKSGDLWILGRHRVLCGDSTKAEDVARLMDGSKADLCFTSPPYGQQRDYTAEGKEKCTDWDGLMQGVFANLPMSDAGQVLVNLGLIHRNCEWIPYWENWIEWMRGEGWRRFGWYVWDQGSGLPGDWNGRFAPSHEFIWHFNKSTERPKKTIATQDATRARKGQSIPIGFRKEGGSVACTSPDKIGQDFKIPDSVIRINRSPVDGKLHPATFPVALPSFAMKCWPGDIYEPFCGSGTTLIAAEQLGRTCYGMEISPQYVDVICSRWENLTGLKAVLAND